MRPAAALVYLASVARVAAIEYGFKNRTTATTPVSAAGEQAIAARYSYTAATVY